MSDTLNSHQRNTLHKVFNHPTSGNLEWRQVISLLESLGTVGEEHDGKFKVKLGSETRVLQRPRGKDIDTQMIVDLRHMLTEAGFAPGGDE